MTTDLIPCCGHCDHMPPRDGHDDACRHGCNDPKPKAVLICSDERHQERVETLIAERDKAREECGHEKAMRSHLAEELSGWIKRANAIEAERDEARAEIERLLLAARLLGKQRDEALAKIEAAEVLASRWIGMGVLRSMKATTIAGCGEDLRATLAPQPASPAADSEHVHVCVTCAATWDGEKWVTA